MRKRVIYILLLSLFSLNIQAQERNVTTRELDKLLSDFRGDYLYLVNDLSNRRYTDKNNRFRYLIDKQITKIINSHFTAVDSRVYNFNYNFDTREVSRPFSKIKDFLDYSSQRLKEVITLEFYDVKKHEFYSDCKFLFTCSFNLKVNLLERRDSYYTESRGRLIIRVVNNSLKIEGIYNEHDPTDLPREFFKDVNCNQLNDESEDLDDDNIFGEDDVCPEVAGPVENNGCPWPNKDGDSLPDKDDACPEIIGPVENKGCPWPDTDGDGILDKDDKCPDISGPIMNKGCPWLDKDGDGVFDKDDACPKVKGAKENSGCPWPDRDGDGILDKDDACPNKRGYYNGCPYEEKYYFSKRFNVSLNIGIGTVFHPRAKKEHSFFGFERNISSFDSGIGSSPVEAGISVEFLFDKKGNMKQGFRLGLAYNSYPYRHMDTSQPLTTDSDLLTNAIATPKFITSSFSYRVGFFPLRKPNKDITRLNFLVFNFGVNMQSQIFKESTDDFFIENPMYGFIHTRIYIFYINFGYPLYELNGEQSFINPRIVNENTEFIPYTFSFGLEIPF